MTGGHGFGPDHRLKTAAALSTLWDGSGIRRLRAGEGITDLSGRRLALHLMVQPDVAAAFLSEPILRDQGLLSRMLVAAPETLAGKRIWRETAEDLDPLMKRYIAVVLGILERPAPAANDAGNELTPRTRLSWTRKPKPRGSPFTTVSRARWLKMARLSAFEMLQARLPKMRRALQLC